MTPLTPGELAALRATATAAAKQLRDGPKEWPGKPSAQRLAFFMAASPEKILRLLNMVDPVPDDQPEVTPAMQPLFDLKAGDVAS